MRSKEAHLNWGTGPCSEEQNRSNLEAYIPISRKDAEQANL